MDIGQAGFYFLMGWAAGILFLLIIAKGAIRIRRRVKIEYLCDKHGWVDLKEYISQAEINEMQKTGGLYCPICVAEAIKKAKEHK